MQNQFFKVLALLFCAVSTQAFSQNLYEHKGNAITESTVPAAYKHRLYETKLQYFESIKTMSEDVLIDAYIEERALKKKKTEQEIRTDLFTVKTPNDKDIKKFYDKNKDSIPYPLDLIKDKVSEALLAERQSKIRNDLLKKLKRKAKYKLTLERPLPPHYSFELGNQVFKGPANSRLELVAFADYKCPHCGELHKILDELEPKLKSKVKYYYLDYPLEKEGLSTDIARGAFCVKKQNAELFWEYNKKAFDRQFMTTKSFSTQFAQDKKLNVKDFEKCLASKESLAAVHAAQKQGRNSGVRSTPVLFLNGERLKPFLTAKGLWDQLKTKM